MGRVSVKCFIYRLRSSSFSYQLLNFGASNIIIKICLVILNKSLNQFFLSAVPNIVNSPKTAYGS